MLLTYEVVIWLHCNIGNISCHCMTLSGKCVTCANCIRYGEPPETFLSKSTEEGSLCLCSPMFHLSLVEKGRVYRAQNNF